jgi:hypothetical protein
MLPTSITVNAGSPATDHVFSGIQRDGNVVTYAMDSPQMDLTGVWTLKFAAEQTSKGITRSLVKLVRPVYDGIQLKYVGDIGINVTLVRPANLAKSYSEVCLEIVRELLAQTDVAAAVITARH